MMNTFLPSQTDTKTKLNGVAKVSSNPLTRLQNPSSASQNAIRRILKGNFIQRFGRFYTFRQGYSLIQNIIQKFDHNILQKQKELSFTPSIFDEFCVENAVKEMQNQSVTFGLDLPSKITREIYDYAANNYCFEPGHERQFKIDEIENGYLKNEHPVFRALVSDSSRCQAIEKITKDPILLKIACSYLGYYPRLVTQHLTWSIASNSPLEEIKKNYPPTNFHADIAGYNFVTVSFYITDVNVESGPHIMIRNSHRNKPFSVLFLSGRIADEKVYNYYGQDEMVIVGKAGFGFFQDPSCIHKLVPPVTQNRLLLQIRYS